MLSPSKQKVIQIELTNACINKCSNCTRFCGHHRAPFMMDFETFKKAVDSMKGYTGIVGMMGGEPTTHPQFKQFVEYFRDNFGHDDFTNSLYKPEKNFIGHICKNVFNLVNNNQRGLWSSVSKYYAKNFELIQDTFGYQALNDHSQPSFHESLMISRKELGIDDTEWINLRDNCWIQTLWSSSITPKGAFFCEIAAAMDMLLDGPGGWPIEPGWWQRTPDEFGDQLKWCELCGASLPMPKRDANEGIDDVSPLWMEMLKEIRSPKLKKEGKIELFNLKTYNKADYDVINESLPYLKDQSKRIGNSSKYLMMKDLAIILDVRKLSADNIYSALKTTKVDMLIVESEEQLNIALEKELSYIQPSTCSPEDQKILLENKYKDVKWILLLHNMALHANPISVFDQYVLNPGCLYQKFTSDNEGYQLFNIDASSLGGKIDLENLSSQYPDRKKINMDFSINPKFSIIIPVFNAAEYLPNIVKSLLNQTVQDFEVIFVNDCSTDDSGIVLENLSTDNRIRVFNHDENSCQGIARNTGLNKALGEYVLYVDADDDVVPTYIETLYEAIKKDDSDMVICNSVWKHPEKDFYRNNFTAAPDTKYLFLEEEDALKRFFNIYEKDLSVPVEPWGKMIKRSIIEENNLRHPEGFMEDIVMTFQELVFCKKVAFISDYLYFYNRKNIKAATLTEKARYVKSIPNAVGGIINFLKERNLFEKYKDIITMFYIVYLNGSYSFFSKGENLKTEMLEAMNIYAALLEEPLEIADMDSAANSILNFYFEMKKNNMMEACSIMFKAHPSLERILRANIKAEQEREIKDKKIFINYHNDFPVYKDEVFTPIQVGKSITGLNLDMISDDTGDNISSKNENYCELTAMYWAYKNVKSDYIGFCHYRRFFDLRPHELSSTNRFINVIFNDYKQINENLFTQMGYNNQENINKLIEDYDVILPKKQPIEQPLGGSVKQQYISGHNEKDWDELIKVLYEKHPEYQDKINNYFNSGDWYCYLMFVMKYDIFIDCMDWIFDILFEVEKRIEISCDDYQKRALAFMGERLLSLYANVFLKERFSEARIKEVPVIFLNYEEKPVFSVSNPNGKIVFVSHEASRTGAPILFLQMLEWIKNNTSIEFEILLKRGGEITEDFRKLAPCSIIEGMPQEELLGLLQRYRKENIKLIYSNTIANGQLQQFLSQINKPQICHIHELNYVIDIFGEENFKLVNNNSLKFITASTAVKNNLVETKNIPSEKIEVAHAFIKRPDADNFNDDLKKRIKSGLNIPDDALIVGGAAMVQWRKGTDLFINMAKLINKRLGNKVHFVWIGYYSPSDYYRYNFDIEKAGLKDVFHLLNQCSNPHDYLYTYDIFVMPSREDPFPLVNLEAAFFEKPVLCFEDSGGTPELVENDAGFVVPYLDIEEMAIKAVELLQNPELRNKMGKAGAYKVNNIYNVDVMVPKILQIVSEVINQAP